MKNKTIRAKKILKGLGRYKSDPDSHFDLDKLLKSGRLYFQMEDYYGYNGDDTASGSLRKKTIEILLHIYTEWQDKLIENKIEHYLAIWLNFPRLGKSQVVCGIRNEINYYNNEVFLSGSEYRKFETLHFGKISEQLNKLSWEIKIDLHQVHDWEINFPMQNYQVAKDYYSCQRKYRNNIKSAIRKIENADGNIYLFPVGDVWVGKAPE